MGQLGLHLAGRAEDTDRGFEYQRHEDGVLLRKATTCREKGNALGHQSSESRAN